MLLLLTGRRLAANGESRGSLIFQRECRVEGFLDVEICKEEVERICLRRAECLLRVKTEGKRSRTCLHRPTDEADEVLHIAVYPVDRTTNGLNERDTP